MREPAYLSRREVAAILPRASIAATPAAPSIAAVEHQDAPLLELRAAWLASLDEDDGDATSAVIDRMCSIPARTLAGLAFKTKISAECDHECPCLVESIMDDILELAKGELDA